MLSNHTHLITDVTGVWLLKPEVCSFNILSRPEPGHAHKSTILYLKDPIPNLVLTGHRKPTDNPTKNYTASTMPKRTPVLPSTQDYLISCMCRGTPPPHNHTHFTPPLPYLVPLPCFTGVNCLILNCHGLTSDLLPRPPRQRSHGTGPRPPIVT